jgi:antitoxin ParD1/3/4
MQISLSSEQTEWLEARIADGEFASVDDAMRQLIEERIALDEDDLSWALEDVEAGRLAAARGEVVSLADALAGMDRHLASLKR